MPPETQTETPDIATTLLQQQPTLDAIVGAIRELEDRLRMHKHAGYDDSQRLRNTLLDSAKLVNSLVLGDGATFPAQITMQIAEGQGDTFIKAGTIADGDFANTGAGNGFILGIDDSDGNKVKFYFGTSSTNSIVYDGTTLTINGTLTVASINIGGDDATSAHIDTAGNFWTGADNSSFATAPARISNAGAAVFQSIQVGGTTRQYQVGDAGIFNFGDGSDGNTTISVNTTLTADKYYDALIINTGITLTPAGYRIFCRTSCTINGTGTIAGNGNTGGNGSNGGNASAGVRGAVGTGGSAAAALADGFLKGAIVSNIGGNGGQGWTSGGAGTLPTAGANGTGTANSIGSNGVAGVTGGAGGTSSSVGGSSNASAGGTAGTATASNTALKANWQLQPLLDIGSTGTTIKFDNSANGGGSGGGGGGQAPGGDTGGGGGGGGASGGDGRIVAIYAKTITIGASASITANGGTGGNGGNGGNGFLFDNAGGAGGGGGSGGTGGTGGVVVLVYNSLTNSGTIQATGGTGGSLGTGGTGTGTGTVGANGSAGTTGAAGVLYQFTLSL